MGGSSWALHKCLSPSLSFPLTINKLIRLEKHEKNAPAEKANTIDLTTGSHPQELSCPLSTQAVFSQCHLETAKLSSTQAPQQSQGVEVSKPLGNLLLSPDDCGGSGWNIREHPVFFSKIFLPCCLLAILLSLASVPDKRYGLSGPTA